MKGIASKRAKREGAKTVLNRSSLLPPWFPSPSAMFNATLAAARLICRTNGRVALARTEMEGAQPDPTRIPRFCHVRARHLRRVAFV